MCKLIKQDPQTKIWQGATCPDKNGTYRDRAAWPDHWNRETVTHKVFVEATNNVLISVKNAAYKYHYVVGQTSEGILVEIIINLETEKIEAFFPAMSK